MKARDLGDISITDANVNHKLHLLRATIQKNFGMNCIVAVSQPNRMVAGKIIWPAQVFIFPKLDDEAELVLNSVEVYSMNIHKQQLRGIKYQVGLDDWKEAKPSVRSYDEKKIIQYAYNDAIVYMCTE
jgi:hypothetical protein